MKPIIEKLAENFTVAEGPHWDEKQQCLYYVDPLKNSIHKYVPSTNQHTKAVLDFFVSFVLPEEGHDDRFVIGSVRDILSVRWDGLAESVSEVKKLAEVDTQGETQRDNKLNDGKADPTGKLWTGTASPFEGGLDSMPDTGSIYSFGNVDGLRRHAGGIKLSNGLAWSDDLKKFYYVDSPSGSVDQFDYDVKSGTISNRQKLFTLAEHNIDGVPDGMTIDTEGNLWVAAFGSHKVIKIDTRKPEVLLDVLEMPAEQVTSVTFGGENLDELYVTSAYIASMTKSDDAQKTGALYRVTGLGAKGFPGVAVKL